MENNKTLYNPDTTIVTGIICNLCNGELPPMTMTDHLESKFNTECPHTIDYDAIIETAHQNFLKSRQVRGDWMSGPIFEKVTELWMIWRNAIKQKEEAVRLATLVKRSGR
jgi:hypothetical protein